MAWQPTNTVEQERLNKVETLRSRGVDPYPARVERTHTAARAVKAFEAVEGQEQPPVTVTVCGRIRRVNLTGKIAFMHIEDETGRLQLFLRINDLGEDTFKLVSDKLVDTDDFVQASGDMMRTRAGEVSVHATSFRLIAKALSPLPVIKQVTQEDGSVVEYGEFSDIETRYRQRYADLAVNRQVREIFVKRSRLTRSIRDYLDSLDFLEVETPILQPIYGGAAARPFTTHHNELDQDMFLRVSFELYLKRLLVGGYDAVYEIGRDFRNEGVSYKHNPEFTQLEFYKAYIDYRGVMEITENMVAHAARAVTGSTLISHKGRQIELAPPWRRVTMRDIIIEYSGIDYMDYPTAETLETAIRARGIAVGHGLPWGKLIEHLFSEFAENNLISPTIVHDYPRDISPFAKRVEGDDLHVERFEFYISGMELGNAFTELNDPLDQEQRFLDMAATFRAGDDDETPLDEDYLRSMRYGMPPNGGFGMGIDRLAMLLLEQPTIRDVLLYPHMRDEK
ncbi:MAG: lysine--tRNA ligase [Chloroflexi bacterium]|nr:lysine--tRNA ligase [Chloroflexota bacterium]